MIEQSAMHCNNQNANLSRGRFLHTGASVQFQLRSVTTASVQPKAAAVQTPAPLEGVFQSNSLLCNLKTRMQNIFHLETIVTPVCDAEKGQGPQIGTKSDVHIELLSNDIDNLASLMKMEVDHFQAHLSTLPLAPQVHAGQASLLKTRRLRCSVSNLCLGPIDQEMTLPYVASAGLGGPEILAQFQTDWSQPS